MHDPMAVVLGGPAVTRGGRKKIKKKRRYVRTFFCELAQMYVVFSFYFFGRPLCSDE
jgi:hypothetical protein